MTIAAFAASVTALLIAGGALFYTRRGDKRAVAQEQRERLREVREEAEAALGAPPSVVAGAVGLLRLK